MEKQESEVSNAIPPTDQLDELLAQAEPRNWGVRCLAALLRFGRKESGPWDDPQACDTIPHERDAQLIVLAVNALPKLLEFVELVREFLGKGESVDSKPNEQTCDTEFQRPLDERSYSFTTDQLYRVLQGAVELYVEFHEKHGYEPSRAAHQAAYDVIDGLDSERYLQSIGEGCSKHSQIVPGSGVGTQAAPSDSLREQKLSAIRNALASVDSALKQKDLV